MKSFNILFSILAIVVFATGCMHKEKELLTPAQPELRQAIYHQTTQENKGGDAILRGSICDAPTNLVETPITTGGITLSWTGSASSYHVAYYLNGNLLVNMVVNQAQVQVPFPIVDYPSIVRNIYNIEIRSICNNGMSSVMSLPLIGSNDGGGSGTGGTAILVADDLNNLTSLQGTVIYGLNVLHSYKHNLLYTASSVNNNNNPIIKATNLYNSNGLLAFPSSENASITLPSTPTTNPYMIKFKTPNPTSSNCPSGINMTVNLPSNLGSIYAVAYSEDAAGTAGTQWYIMECTAGSKILLPGLKRNTNYKIRFFEIFSNLYTYTPPTTP